MPEKICPNPKCYNEFWYRYIMAAYEYRKTHPNEEFNLEIENGKLGCQCRFSPDRTGEAWQRIDAIL